MELICPKCKNINWEETDSEIDCDEGTYIQSGICNKCGCEFKIIFNATKIKPI